MSSKAPNVNTSDHLKEYRPKHPQFRRALCRHFENGKCLRGDLCNFAHGRQQLIGASEIKAGKPSSPKCPSPTFRQYQQLSNDYVMVELDDSLP